MITYKQGLLFLALLSMASTVQAGTPFDLDLKELDQQKAAQPQQKEKQSSFDLDVKELERQKKSQHQKEKKASFDLDLKELERQKAARPRQKGEHRRKSGKPAPAVAGRPEKGRQSAAVAPNYLRYTIRPGDHIFKILVTKLGMSDDAAESLIPSIVRLNHISDIKQLKVGSTILIPGKGGAEGTERPAKGEEAQNGVTELREAAPPQAAPKHPPRSDASQVREPHAAPPAELQKAPTPAAPAAMAPEAALPAVPAAAASKASAPAAPVVAAPAKAVPHPAPIESASKPSAPAPAAPAATAPKAAAPVPVATAHKDSPPAPAAASHSAVTWICAVTEPETSRIVDSLLNALSISWSKNKIIESGEGTATAFSIRVDRYFEYKGGRYIVSIGKNDPFSYTLLGLLESTGYRVLRIGGGEDFKLVGEKLLTLVGVAGDFGRHPLQEGRVCTGFLVQQDGAGGRRVLLTGDHVGTGEKWLMAPGCGAK